MYISRVKPCVDISLNSQYLVLFKSVQDVEQIFTLAKRMGCPHLIDAYREVTKVIVSLRFGTPDYLRIRSHILPH